MSKYRDLEVWDDACHFAKDIYLEFRESKEYGLKDQITRSALSIASNIAEGSDRGSDADFSRFLKIAKASCEECRTQLYIAYLANFLTLKTYQTLDTRAKSISNRLGALIKYLKKPRPSSLVPSPSSLVPRP